MEWIKMTVAICSLMILTSCVTYETHLVPNGEPFAELYARHIDQEILIQDFYYNITNLTTGDYKFVTIENSSLIIEKPGFYSVNSQFAFSDGANTEFHLALGINGERQEDCHTERKLGTGGDVGSASFTCISYFNTSDIITLMIENVDNVQDPTLHSLDFNIRRISP